MPDMNLADESLGWLVLALGVMVLGLAGLLARRPAPAWRPWAAAAGLLALAGTAWALGLAPPVTLGLAGLASLQALFAASGLAAVRRAAALLAHPRFQASLLVAAGGALVVWQVVRLERAVQAEMAQTDEMLRILGEMIELDPVADRVALTDKGRPIPLFTPRSPEPTSARDEREQVRRLDLDLHLIQTSSADAQYNCHGWVFTGGRYWVRGWAVDQILKENGYRPQARPAPNDVAVFRDHDGTVLHTALVRSVTSDGAVLLESKWGQLGRYIHNDSRHAYSRGPCTYYRSARDGHLLRGLDSSLASANGE